VPVLLFFLETFLLSTKDIAFRKIAGFYLYFNSLSLKAEPFY
jgi:hydrogenase-4 membrane subunit HyfE